MYMNWCLLQEMMEGLKCTRECAYCQGCLTVGTGGDTSVSPLHHGVCSHCSVHPIHAD